MILFIPLSETMSRQEVLFINELLFWVYSGLKYQLFEILLTTTSRRFLLFFFHQLEDGLFDFKKLHHHIIYGFIIMLSSFPASKLSVAKPFFVVLLSKLSFSFYFPLISSSFLNFLSAYLHIAPSHHRIPQPVYPNSQ